MNETATRTCPHCKSEIPYDATACRFCGRPSLSEQATLAAQQATLAVQRTKQRKKLGCVTAVVALAIVIAIAPQVCPQSPEERAAHEKADREISAKLAAETLVKEQLRSPSTAEFSEEAVLDSRGGSYLVHLAVDAQNAFGATIRGYYCVVVSFKEGDSSNYYYDRKYAVQECPAEPDAATLLMMKTLNDWPLTDAAPRAQAAPQESPPPPSVGEPPPGPPPARTGATARPAVRGGSGGATGDVGRRGRPDASRPDRRADAGTGTPATGTAPPAPSDATAVPEVVVLRVSTEPQEAEIRIDGVRVDNPYEGRFASGGPDVEVDVSASGYQPRGQRVHLDHDREFRIVLGRAGTGTPPQDAGAQPRLPPPPATNPDRRPAITTNPFR